MIPLVIAFVFAMALVLQTTVFKMNGGTAPDAALLAAVYSGLRYSKTRGYKIGIAAGFVQDILSYGILGINLLTKGLIGFLAGWLRETHIIDPLSPLTWFMLILLGTGLNEVILQLYAIGFFGTSFSVMDTASSIFFQSFMNLIVGIPFFLFIDKLQGQLKEFLGIREF